MATTGTRAAVRSLSHSTFPHETVGSAGSPVRRAAGPRGGAFRLVGAIRDSLRRPVVSQAFHRHGIPCAIPCEHVEELPEATSEESRTATTRSSGIGQGARSGAIDARTWRDYLLVLFEGTAINRLRTIDIYDRRTLMYRGSALLPFEASRLAVHGDTMVVIAEVEDEPVVAAFLIVPSVAGANRTRH